MPPIHGLIAATFTPMHGDGSLRLEIVPDLVDLLIARGVQGFYVCGSTGEGPLLSSAERRAVAEAYVRAAAGRVPVVIQVGHSSLAEARDLAAHAEAAGADAVSATPATYFKPRTPEEIVDGMALVAAGAPRLPFFYYHIPPITGVEVDVTALMPLAAERVATFAGVKFSSANVHDVVAADLARFTVLFGVDEMLLSGLVAGLHGAVGSTYNLTPTVARATMAAVARGDLAAARASQLHATRIIRHLIAHGGLPMIKAAMAMTGIDVGPVRPPLRRVEAGRVAALRDALAREDLLAAFDAHP
jgi:N-acetylneuraminate lyase